MDEKKLQALAAELNSFSANTLKYFYWTVSKLCTVIELSSDKEGVEYRLQPRNEERDMKSGAPTPEQEAAIMQGLQKKGFFEFQSAIVGADKPIIFGGEHGLTGEAAMRMLNDPRSNLERKYEWGWLENPDLDVLQSYLASINMMLTQRQKINLKIIFSKSLYDTKISALVLWDKEIKIPRDRNEDYLCRIVFANDRNMRKDWESTELIEKSNGRIVSRSKSMEFETWRPVYNAARTLNSRIERSLGIKEFFIINPITTVKVNPVYLA